MARILDRRRAIELRQQGKSWSEIRATISTSKDTLSRWLKDVQLTEEQREKISRESKVRRIENYILAAKAKRKSVEEEVYKKVLERVGLISDRDLLMAGLFLYLGEGAKSNRSRIQITNSDPTIIRFSIFWLSKLGIDREKLKVQIHLYSDMDIEKELKFWRETMEFNRNQFIKPYIKKSSSLRIDHPSFGHGTCSVYYNSVNIKDDIIAGIKVVLNSVLGL